jgi:hypothetical protein
MKSNIKRMVLLSLLIPGVWIWSSCKKEKEAGETDQALYEMANSSNGFTWYKFSDTLLDKSSGSGHPQAFLRTRYNAAAATKLDSSGKIVNGAVFPEGALIVKELYEDENTLVRYAILYKDGDSPDADDKGWVWGYIDKDGTVAEPASKKGTACISCHLQAENIDYMLMNKYFP